MRRVALAFAALAGVAGAASGAVQTLTIGDLYAGGTINLAPADTLEVRLSAGPNGCAVWATIASPPVEGQTFAAANRLLVSLAAREPRLRIVPWAAAAEQAGVLGGDGVHPNDAGARLRASLYARAARSCV